MTIIDYLQSGPDMSKDTNFDQHSSRFKKNIYDTAKGQIRLKLVLQDIMQNIPILNDHKTINVLDAGCGMGQISKALFQKNRQFTLCDISSDMLTMARETLGTDNTNTQFIHSSVQDLGTEHDHKYDLIIFHAVLEWLDKPEAIIPVLKRRLKPGGYLSLMFYNVNSIIFYNLLKGNFIKVLKQDFKGHPGGLTPINPIDPVELDSWLESNQFKTHKKTGIRVLYDYLNKDLKESRSLEDIMEIESIYAHQEPFNMMGRYVHYICQLPLEEKL